MMQRRPTVADCELSCKDAAEVLRQVAVAMQKKHIKQIRDLDAEIGDGDLGITVQKGFQAVEELIAGTEVSEIAPMLNEVGMVFSEANPSTFSAFFATAFRKAAVVMEGKKHIGLNDIADMFEAAVNGIMKLGKARSGDKTMLDALVPAAQAFQKGAQSGSTLLETLQEATVCAREGMEHTKELKAQVGRARSFGERTVGIQDPGATVVYLFLDELTGSLSNVQQYERR
jgi:dihydroxyacetone kinase-like protein